VRFVLWPSQLPVARALVEHLLVVILKARQLGMTWLVLAYALWLMLFKPAATVLLFSRRDDEAIVMLDEKIADEGEDMPSLLSLKATALSRVNDAAGALSAMDAAIEKKPGNGQLLNNRCWIKGTLNTQLDSALADCTRAIQLSDNTAAALDSRAMVYFRMGKLAEALADLDAALEQRPSAASSLFLRGIVKAKLGKAKDGEADLAGARLLSPKVDAESARWGIKA
jgi:tetratricopeptide (TPR) repeat protein